MSKNILITGASRGIGAATALLAARRGWNVCVNYYASHDAAQHVVSQITQIGGKALALKANIGEETEVVDLFRRFDNMFGSLHALVNNAGVLETQMRVDQMEIGRLVRIFDVNVIGSFLCAREATRRMSTKRGGNGGAIVNISSVAARLGSPNEYVDYAASKAAIDTLTVGLAREVADEGVRVNAVRPGLIATEIHARGGEPGRIARLRSAIPMKREGSAEEVAKAVLWLVSDEASYTTGSFIDVAGGR